MGTDRPDPARSQDPRPKNANEVKLQVASFENAVTDARPPSLSQAPGRTPSGAPLKIAFRRAAAGFIAEASRRPGRQPALFPRILREG